MAQSINMYEDSGWEEAAGYPAGAKRKTLRDEHGVRTMLLKLSKGFHMESHAHMYHEQHIVLDGEYESEGTVFPSGTYRMIPAHQNHGPFTSRTGAILLVMWDPIE
ncbi:MAG: cupin domain-containing protein [Bacteroidota bacterium]